MNISNNISSIQANQTALNTSSYNIANVNTDGFIPSNTNIVEKGNSVSTNTRQADNSGSSRSQTDLAKEIPDQIVIARSVEANVNAIKTQDEMLGSLLDIKA